MGLGEWGLNLLCVIFVSKTSMRLSLLLIVFGSVLVSCQKPKEGLLSPVKFPQIIDTLPPTDSFLKVNSMQSALDRTYLYAIARFDTSVIVLDDSNLIDFWNRVFDETAFETTTPIEVLVDTTQLRVIEDDRYWYLRTEGEENKRKYYKAWPVFIVNNGDSTHIVETQDSRMSIMIQEAKDLNGQWKPIEYWTHSLCGNSYYSFALPPKHCAIIKIPIYKGNFETELRVKYKKDSIVFYSKPFRGSINLSQFERKTED